MQIEYIKDTFKEYLSKSDYISASDLKYFLQSPRFYKYKKTEEEEKPKEERHFVVGSALHELILEPELFRTTYAVSPKFDLRTTKGKEGLAEFQKEADGKTILNVDEFEMIVLMAQSASQNKTFIELIGDSYRELSCYTKDSITGLNIRMRPDCFCKNKSTIVDIKSCVQSNLKAFKSDVYKYGYSISSAFYMDYLKRENYVFCAIEKQPPHQTSLFMLDDEMIAFGRAQYRMGLDLLKWSMDNDYWCDYNEFEILKECYELGNIDRFYEINNESEKITIIR